MVASGTSTCSALTAAVVIRMISIGALALSMVSEPRPAGPPVSQPAPATVPHNAADTTTRRCLFTLLKFPREAIADLKLRIHNGEGQEKAEVQMTISDLRPDPRASRTSSRKTA